MKTLPNGLTVFNATPHPISFWQEEWDEVVVVESDERVDARIIEAPYSEPETGDEGVSLLLLRGIELVTPRFEGTVEGVGTIERAFRAGASIIVGSIIAAQAYPGLVVAMTPAPGYERTPPAEKRMRPDKFTVFTGEE